MNTSVHSRNFELGYSKGHQILYMPVATESPCSTVGAKVKQWPHLFPLEKFIGPACHVITKIANIRPTSFLKARLNYPTSR